MKEILVFKKFKKDPSFNGLFRRLFFPFFLLIILLSPATAFASAFTLNLNPNHGPQGTVIYLNGYGFAPEKKGQVWFDTDGNGKKSAKEPAKKITANYLGNFSAFLTLPEQIRPGWYAIYADVPAGGQVEAWEVFYVTTGLPSEGLPSGNLEVANTTPPDGAVNVQRMPGLKLVFDNNIIKGPDYKAITLADEDGNEVKSRIEIKGKTIRVYPTGMLKPEKTYLLFIPAEAILDLKRTSLAENLTLTFTTKK